jgi:quercetin dioxygenase-like cupin family protein
MNALNSVAALAIAFAAYSVASAAEHAQVHESVAPQFSHAIPNVQGKTFTSAIVTFPPGAKAAPHRHGDAFVYAYVLSGAVRSQLDGAPARIYRTGEDWFEPPGAHHVLTENVSGSASAKLLVVFVADAGVPLKVPDPVMPK